MISNMNCLRIFNKLFPSYVQKEHNLFSYFRTLFMPEILKMDKDTRKKQITDQFTLEPGEHS